MATYPVLVGQTCLSRLEYLGDEDRFGPFAIISKESGEPSATGLTRRDAIDWMQRFVGWGRLDARKQVDEAIQWYHECEERAYRLPPDVPGSYYRTGAGGQ